MPISYSSGGSAQRAETAETPSLGEGTHAQPAEENEFSASAYSATCEQAVSEATAQREQEAGKVQMT